MLSASPGRLPGREEERGPQRTPQFGPGAPLELLDAGVLSELAHVTGSLSSAGGIPDDGGYAYMPFDGGASLWPGLGGPGPCWGPQEVVEEPAPELADQDSMVSWMHCDPDLLESDPAEGVGFDPFGTSGELLGMEPPLPPQGLLPSPMGQQFPSPEFSYFIPEPVFALPPPRPRQAPEPTISGFSPEIIRTGVSWLQPQRAVAQPHFFKSWGPLDPSSLSEFHPIPLQELLLESQSRRGENLLDFLLGLLQRDPPEFYRLLEQESHGGPITEAVRDLNRACMTTSLGLSLPPLQARLLKFLVSCLLARVYDRGLLMLIKYGCAGAKSLAGVAPRKFQEPCYGFRLAPAARELANSSLRDRDDYYRLEADADPYYAQKLLDYYYGDERNPYLGCFTLSNIGTSFHTFHKPQFDNTLAIFRVRVGSRNSELFDAGVEQSTDNRKPNPRLSHLYACSGRTVLVEHLEPFPLAVSLPGMAYRFIYLHNLKDPEIARRKILTSTAENRQISHRLQSSAYVSGIGPADEVQADENEVDGEVSQTADGKQGQVHQKVQTGPCIPAVPQDAIYFYDNVPDSHPLTRYIFEDENGNAACAKDEEDRFELVYPFMRGPQGHVRISGYHMRNRFLLVRARSGGRTGGSMELMRPSQAENFNSEESGISVRLRATEWLLRPLPCCILAGQLHPSTAMTFPKSSSTRTHQEDNAEDQEDSVSSTSQGGMSTVPQQKPVGRPRKSGKNEGRSQNDNAVTVLNADSVKLYMQSRCTYCFKKMIDASPDHILSVDTLLKRYEGLTFSASKNAFGRETIKAKFAAQEGDKYYGLREDQKYYESVESNKGNVYSSPLQMLLVENMLASGTWVSNFLDNAHADSFVWELANVSVGNCSIKNGGSISALHPGAEASVGRFLADRFKGWINIICSFLTSERLKFFVTLREKSDFQSFGIIEQTSYQSFGGYFLRHGDKISRFRSLRAHQAEFWDRLDTLDPSLRPPASLPDLIFDSPLHPIRYDLESVSDSAKYAESMYSLFSDPAYRSSFFYFTDKLFAANFSFLGLFTRKCEKNDHSSAAAGSVESFRQDNPDLQKLQETLQTYEADLFNDIELARELRFDPIKAQQVVISEGLCNCQQSRKENVTQDDEMEHDITSFGLNVREIRRMRNSSTRSQEFQAHCRTYSTAAQGGSRRAANRPGVVVRAPRPLRPRPALQIILAPATTSRPSRIALTGLRVGPVEQPKPEQPRTSRGRSSEQCVDPSSLLFPPLPMEVVDKQASVYAQLNVRLIDMMVKKLNPIDIIEAIANRNVPNGAQGIPAHCLKRTYCQPCGVQPTLTEYLQQFAKRINCRMRVYLTSHQRHLVRRYLEKVSTDKAMSKISTYMNILEGEAASLRLDARLDTRMPKVYAIDPTTWSSGRWVCEYGRCPLVSDQSKRGHLAPREAAQAAGRPGARPLTYEGYFRSNIIPQPKAWANPRAPKGVKIFLPENYGSHYYPTDRLAEVGIRMIPYLSEELAARCRAEGGTGDAIPLRMYPYHVLHSNPPTLVTRGERPPDAWGPAYLAGRVEHPHRAPCPLEPQYSEEVLRALDQAGRKISHIDDKKKKKSYKVIRMTREAVEHCEEFATEGLVTYKTFSDRWTNWLGAEPYVYDRKLSYTVSVVQKLEQESPRAGQSQVRVVEKNIGEVLGKSYWFPRRVVNSMAEIVYKCHAVDMRALIGTIPKDSFRVEEKPDLRHPERRVRYEDQDYGEEAKAEEACYYYVLPIVPDRAPLNHHMRGNLNIRIGSVLKREFFTPEREAQQAMYCQTQRDQWEAECESREAMRLPKFPMPTIPTPTPTEPPAPHYRSRGLYSDYLVYPGIGI